MKRLNVLLFAMAMIAMSGCTVIGGLLKAGAAVGVIAVIVVILVIIWVISMFRGR